MKAGKNEIKIEVSNTWHNRLIGDNLLPADKRVTWTTAPFRLKDKPLLPAGLVGEVKFIFKMRKQLFIIMFFLWIVQSCTAQTEGTELQYCME